MAALLMSEAAAALNDLARWALSWGMAIAARIAMMATTIMTSMSVNPSFLLLIAVWVKISCVLLAGNRFILKQPIRCALLEPEINPAALLL